MKRRIALRLRSGSLKSFSYAFRVTFHKAPDEILVGIDKGSAHHPGIMREIDAGLAHVHQKTRARFSCALKFAGLENGAATMALVLSIVAAANRSPA